MYRGLTADRREGEAPYQSPHLTSAGKLYHWPSCGACLGYKYILPISPLTLTHPSPVRRTPSCWRMLVVTRLELSILQWPVRDTKSAAAPHFLCVLPSQIQSHLSDHRAARQADLARPRLFRLKYLKSDEMIQILKTKTIS